MMAAAGELDKAPAAAAAAAAALGPGFRFHPTDEELVKYYLERKVSGRPLRFDCIAEIDLYKFDPSVLPGLSRLQTRDLEWYFFTALDRKYSHGSKTNRATGQGYWKTTGKDNPVFHQSRIVGMKKALVYHFGRAPHGQRTNWVMHEYRLEDESLSQSGNPQDTFVLCRIFQKSGSGPKNGEQYGAPFIEEEWADNNYTPVIATNNVDEGNGKGVGFTNLQSFEILQIHVMAVPELPDVDSSLELQNTEDAKADQSSNSSQLCTREDSLLDLVDIADNFAEEDQKLRTCAQNKNLELNDISTDGDSDSTPNVESIDASELYFDAPSDDGLLFEHELFFDVNYLDCPEENHLMNQIETNLTEFDWVDKFLPLDALDDNLHEGAIFDSSSLQDLDFESSFAHALEAHKENLIEAKSLDSEAAVPCGGSAREAISEDKKSGVSLKRKAENCNSHDGNSASDDKLGGLSGESVTAVGPHDGYGDGFGKSLTKRFHKMLDIVAPPASASEDQYKLNSKLVGNSAGTLLPPPIHVEAGIICLSDISVNPHISSMSKDGYLGGCLLTYREINSSKASTSVVLRNLLYYAWIWVCLFALSFKVVISIRAK